jgi:hypothetical protein
VHETHVVDFSEQLIGGSCGTFTDNLVPEVGAILPRCSDQMRGAARHAFGDLGSGEVQVELIRQSTLCLCSVSDDGMGFVPLARIKILNG